MLRALIILISLALITCSPDRPLPIGPAGKSAITVDASDTPSSLRVNAVTDASVTISWDAAEDVTGYNISYKKTDSRLWIDEPHEGVLTHHTIYNLEAGVEYSWAVRAVYSDGVSRWIVGEHFTTQGGIPEREIEHIAAEYIYFSDGEVLRRCNVYGASVEDIIEAEIDDFELDRVANKVYWLNKDGRFSLKRADLDGTNEEVVLYQSTFSQAALWFKPNKVDQLVLDATLDLVYWYQRGSSSREGYLIQASLETATTQVIHENINQPTKGMTLDPDTGRVYWFENSSTGARIGGRSATGKIQKGHVHYFDPNDSSYQYGIIEEYGGVKPEGMTSSKHLGKVSIISLAIDPIADKIYWSLAREPHRSAHRSYIVRRANRDGSDVETLVEYTSPAGYFPDEESAPISRMVVDGITGRMYFTRGGTSEFCAAEIEDLYPSAREVLFYWHHLELPYIGRGLPVRDFHIY